MLKLNESEKTDLWGGITMIFLAICGFLVLNQMVNPAIDKIVATRLPLWVLWPNLGLMLLCSINAVRHARKSNN
jgi:hypothetical protein